VSGKTDFEIKLCDDAKGAYVSPRSLGITPHTYKNTVKFSIDGPQKIIVQFGNFENLIILADPAEKDAPSPQSPDVINASALGVDLTGKTSCTATLQKAIDDALPISTESPDKWTTAQKIRASFDAQRSGDLYVVLKKYVSPITKPSEGYVATHGSVWDYDRRVPILMWRKGMRPSDRQDHISTVNILPTIAAEIGLALPTQLDGRCLNGVEGVACPVR
jgi:hypothetical protein